MITEPEKGTIRKTPVAPAKLQFFCECGTEVKDTGMTLTVAPPLYQHRCPKCGKVYRLDKSYPCIVHESQ